MPIPLWSPFININFPISTQSFFPGYSCSTPLPFSFPVVVFNLVHMNVLLYSLGFPISSFLFETSFRNLFSNFVLVILLKFGMTTKLHPSYLLILGFFISYALSTDLKVVNHDFPLWFSFRGFDYASHHTRVIFLCETEETLCSSNRPSPSRVHWALPAPSSAFLPISKTAPSFPFQAVVLGSLQDSVLNSGPLHRLSCPNDFNATAPTFFNFLSAKYTSAYVLAVLLPMKCT